MMWEHHFEAGQAALEQQRPDLAILHFQSALAFSQDTFLHLALIEAFQQNQQLEDAFLHAEELYDSNPQNPDFASILGDLYRAQGSYFQAAHIYDQALEIDHQNLTLLQRAAETALALNQLKKAAEYVQTGLSIDARHLELRLILARLLSEQGDRGEAAEVYKAAYLDHPHRIDILNQWLKIQAVENPAEAIQLLIALAKYRPEYRSTLAVQAASLLRSAGEVEEARKSLQLALEDPTLPDREAYQHLYQVISPIIAENTREIEACASRLRTWAEQLEDAPSSQVETDLSNLSPYLNIWSILATLPYLNIDPRPIRQAYGNYFQQILPAVSAPPPPPLREKKRLVFVLYSNSPVYQFMRGTLLKWSTNWDVILAIIPTANNFYPLESLSVQRPDFTYLRLSAHPAKARQQIEELHSDLIFFSEVLADQVLQTFLASQRLAPVQVTSWLSSGTTGIPTIDYFISSQHLEQHQAQRFYSEQLILIEPIPSYIVPPTTPPTPPRSDYGLPEKGALYICPHLLLKLHPDFDLALAGILENDPEGVLVLLARPALDNLRNKILARFESQFPHLMERIWFVPTMDSESFHGLMQIADVLLDPFYFGGGTTSFEAFALNVPIITWPGERLHGRITYGFYQQMGISELVALSPEDYVQKAVQTATDTSFNRAMRQKIARQKHHIFRQAEAVTALEQALENCLSS